MLVTSEISQNSFSKKIKNRINKVMVDSKRRGAWFTLGRSERSMLYLALKLRVKFESLDLLRAITAVLKKLENQGETLYAWLQRGSTIAWAFSEFAVRCGNETAAHWRQDRGYVLFLGGILNTSNGGSFFS